MNMKMNSFVIKPQKVFPLVFMAIFFAIAIPVLWPISWFMVFLLGVVSLLLVALLVDTYSGYLKLDQGLLTRKSLLSTHTIMVSNIRSISFSGGGVLPTSGLSAGAIQLGNAKDGTVAIKISAFKKRELAPLLKQLHSELLSTNPKRAKDFSDTLASCL